MTRLREKVGNCHPTYTGIEMDVYLDDCPEAFFVLNLVFPNGNGRLLYRSLGT